jgi:two-component system cell cycle sensor histidine kinase/response regulator CckA
MALDVGVGIEPGEELVSLRQEVETLRQRVRDLQRRTARRDSQPARGEVEVDVAVSAREELLVEAERIAHVGSWIWNLETNAIFWSDEMFRILGYDPLHDQAAQDAYFERVHPDDRERVRAISTQSLATGLTPQINHRFLLPNGVVRHVSMTAAMLFGAAGDVQRVVGTVRDLTRERALNQKMQRTLELLEEAQALAHLGNWVFHPSSCQLECSPGIYRILGLDPSTPASVERFMDCVHPDDRARVTAIQQRGSIGDLAEDIELRLVRPSGEVRSGRIRSVRAGDPAGQNLEYHGTLLDTTDQVALAQQLARMEKMDAVGRLAGGIAHDFNNLLTVIGANLELWAEASGREPEIQDACRAVRSARSLTQRLLAFGRKAPLAKRVVDPNELVSRTADLVRRVIGDGVRVELDLFDVLPAICVDPVLVEQALINLVINARDAMATGGTVTLRTCVRVAGSGQRMVEIEVADEGPGMDAALKAQIFEPFFTTKGELGTGLGLPTVLGTVEQHGGSVEVDSERGAGARFRLRFPAEEILRAESLAPEPKGPDVEPAGREILVVEDEPLVAAVIARSLERKGHTVLLAQRPGDALGLWRQHPDLALVICDVSMAEMRGPELVNLLRQGGRAVRVLYVTGYSAGVHDIFGDPMLPKPFSPRELQRAVSDLIAN